MSNISYETGFIIPAQYKEEVMQAAMCAYSLKTSNPTARVTVVTNSASEVDPSVLEIFDSVVKYPYRCIAESRANDWQLYWATHYKYNIVLDPKTIIKYNLADTFEYLSANYSVAFQTTATDFKGTPLHLNRTEFDDNDLTKIYTSVWFFTAQDDEAHEYFKLCDPMFQKWQLTIDETIGRVYRHQYYNQDLMHAMAVSRMWQPERFLTNVFNLVDMNSARLLFSRNIDSSWTDYINAWVTDDTKIKIQNYAISDIFYYDDNLFATSEHYEQFKNYYAHIVK